MGRAVTANALEFLHCGRGKGKNRIHTCAFQAAICGRSFQLEHLRNDRNCAIACVSRLPRLRVLLPEVSGGDAVVAV